MNALRKVIFFKDQEIEEVKRQYKSVFLNNRNNNNKYEFFFIDFY